MFSGPTLLLGLIGIPTILRPTFVQGLNHLIETAVPSNFSYPAQLVGDLFQPLCIQTSGLEPFSRRKASNADLR